MMIRYIPKEEFDKVNDSDLQSNEKLSLIAKMCRLNTLSEVKKAGSGHLGSSLSAMDIVVYLYYHYLNIDKVGIDSPDRDIYFSSKGHDVPGLYSVLYSKGIISEDKFLNLRRLGGLDGHPDVNIDGVEVNSGSLGMGISKARGMAKAKKMLKREGRVFVLTGDGELQEGQNFEALQATVQQSVNELVVMVDHNKLQSDRPIDKIVSLGDLEGKFKAFGWFVLRCDGNDISEIEKALKATEKISDKPKVIIFDTIKGKGISFMEHPFALKANKGFYKWHAGAPDDESYGQAFKELHEDINKDLKTVGFGKLNLKDCPQEEKKPSGVSDEFVAVAYGQELVDLAKKNKGFVVLDADLSFDCKIKDFEMTYPERFIECGIAEQDMTSMAGGIASQGLTPVVNSFASFLASRANEQIYNNQTEGNKVIYACHYAGLIPAGPGKSHQSIRDISLFGALPNCAITQASCSEEMKMLVRYAIEDSEESVAFRINIGPSPRIIDLPSEYQLKKGQGVALTEGKELVMFAYGPVMLNEALLAHDLLLKNGIKLKVVNMPWLNRFDEDYLKMELMECMNLYILEDHSPFGGLGDNLIDYLNKNDMLSSLRVIKYGVEGFPACGTPPEALKCHGLDGQSLAKRIIANILKSL